ncbi:hypothetical protein GCM10022225_18290 [Plantactinospora mayteni]|uniref:Uncharacterized protein n=1 Tax=Plantactinospora mayteni TaxID=566021 RepID=A0ABQ4EMY9_9ACTN|nr:hypothetical protein Pma05_25880 [Plantactinospora mayteni]
MPPAQAIPPKPQVVAPNLGVPIPPSASRRTTNQRAGLDGHTSGRAGNLTPAQRHRARLREWV